MDLVITIFLYVLLGLVIFAALARAILLIYGGLVMMKVDKAKGDGKGDDAP